MTAAIGIFGKHPGYGDFITHRLDAPLVKWFQAWLDSVLPVMKEGMGSGWDTGWDHAPVLRFWVGRGIAGRTCAGLLVASRDKVGRRYPMVMMAAGADQSAPVADPDQSLFERLEGALAGMVDTDDDIKDVVSGLASCRGEDEVALQAGPTLWAHHPDGNLDALLGSAAREDAKRAITTRSYWWRPAMQAGDPAVWLGTSGLPDAATLGWLMFGQASTLGGAHAQN